jgi:hypothetical protein
MPTVLMTHKPKGHAAASYSLPAADVVHVSSVCSMCLLWVLLWLHRYWHQHVGGLHRHSSMQVSAGMMMTHHHHHHQITKLSHSINAIGPAPHRSGR